MTLLTPTFKSQMANKFVTDLGQENYYVFAGKTIGYTGNVPEASNSVDGYFLDPDQEMIFGKNVTSTDYNLMIRNKPWTANTTYAQYDNSLEDLENTDFYVVSKEGVDYGVFKCLNNNNDAISTHQPLVSETSASDELYKTSDGYVWKYMYSITDANYKKFATSDYVPLYIESDVVNNAVEGSINSYELTDTGLGYDPNVSGTIVQTNISGLATKFYVQGDDPLTATTNYYVNSALYITQGTGAGQLRKIVGYGVEGNFKYVVVESAFTTQPASGDLFEISPNVVAAGDGTGFQARAIVAANTTFIESIEVVEQGSGYKYADLTIETNESVVDNTYSQATARAIISPKGGHGANSQDELFGHYVCLSVYFIESEVPGEGNDFRTIGVLKNPTFREAIIELNDLTGISQDDTVTQTSTGATGTVSAIDAVNTTITIGNVTGVFSDAIDEVITINSTDYDIIAIDKNTDVFDQRISVGVTYTVGTQFVQDELVIQEDTGAQGYVYNDNGTLFLVNVKGTFANSITDEIIGQTSGTKATINSVGERDMIIGSEDILYVQNVSPITRTISNTERVKIILGF